MRNRNWIVRTGAAVGLALALAAAALADNPTTTPPQKDPPDPPGTTMYMDQLRALFAAWDLNGDNNLDKEELAKAFRGADAKPYDYKKPKVGDKDPAADPTKDPPKDPAADLTKDPSKDPKTTKKPDYSQDPDYDFLVQLDQDGDGQISRAEFMSWARDYAVQLKQQADQEIKLLAMEAKLANATGSSKEIKALEKELKKEQAVAKNLDNQMKAAEKALQQQLKHHKK